MSKHPDLRKAAEMALDALLTCDVDYDYDENPYNTFDAKDVSEAIEALQHALAQAEHPLDKKAANARDLGLDYEPEQEPVAWIEHEWSGTGLRHLHWDRRKQTVRDEILNPLWTPLYAAPLKPEHPLDKKADNARKLGLDYEPDMSTNQQNVNTSEERAHKSDKSIHEPVAWMVLTQDDKKLMLWGQEKPPIFDAPVKLIPLYTAPQKYCPSENNAAYEKGFVEGMAKQAQSSVDRVVNAMTKQWVGLTDEEISEVLGSDIYQEYSGELRFIRAIEAKLKEKNNAV